jgi:hypothetical protein
MGRAVGKMDGWMDGWMTWWLGEYSFVGNNIKLILFSGF